MDLREQAISDSIIRERVTLAVDNGPSVFMDNILNIDLDHQWARKLYHRKVCEENALMAWLKAEAEEVTPLSIGQA